MKFASMILISSLALMGCDQTPKGDGTPVAMNTPGQVESAPPPSGEPPPPPPMPQGAPIYTKGKLEPLPGVKAPKLTKVVKAKFTTTQGDLLMEIYPEAAPKAAKQFVELIKLGFYDNTPIFRVEPGFVCQFGINSKPGKVEWKDKNFKDDPSFFHLGTATLAFAKAGPDTNSTQVFINYNDNSGLVSQGGFTAFGKVVKGYENSTKFKQVPEAGDQGALWSDTEGFIKGLPNKPDQIIKAEIIK